jgi:hypothetical protein
MAARTRAGNTRRKRGNNPGAAHAEQSAVHPLMSPATHRRIVEWAVVLMIGALLISAGFGLGLVLR